MAKKLRWAKHQKRWFGKWHLYLGIFAGVIAAFIGLTGSILVFKDEIDEALNPGLFEVAAQHRRLSTDEVMAIVHRQYPELRYTYITIPESSRPSATYALLNLKNKEQVYINPYNGQICGRRLYESSFIAIVTELHTSMFIPVVGRYVTGLCALILLILTITGLRLWIPEKWKKLKQMLTVKFSGSFKRQNYDWHNVVGFYTAPIVLILSLTGFLISFSIVFIPLIFILNGESPQGVASLLNAKSTEQKNVLPIGLAQLYQIAGKIMPESEIRGIASPADKKGSYRIDLLKKGFPVSGRRQMLTLDQYSGRVLLNSDKDFPEVGQAYLSWLTPLHYGSFGGLPTKILALIAGLSPMVLCITGFIIWWPRLKKQRRQQQKAHTENPVAATESLRKASKSTGLVIHLKKGFIYGCWMLLVAVCAGLIYGLPAGIVIQPSLFMVLFCTLVISVNFLIALVLMLLNALFLMPFKKSFRNITRYFSWSLGIFTVFMIVYMLTNYSAVKVF